MKVLLPFLKVQSIGNDFVLIQERDLTHAYRELSEGAGRGGVAVAPKSIDALRESIAIRTADRRFGVGSDGLLTIEPQLGGLKMRMFNPDGTEDYCGNGLRCAAHVAFSEGLVGTREFSIEHGGKPVLAQILENGRVLTTLGPAIYEPKKVPVLSAREVFKESVWSGMVAGDPQSFFGSALTTGSTHVVIPTHALPDDASFRAISAKIEVDGRYPDRTSVIWVQELAPRQLKIRIWERGAGETLGCGTGSSAAAADYLRRRDFGGTVEVVNPGGTVTITAERWDAPLLVKGEASIVYRGRIALEEL